MDEKKSSGDRDFRKFVTLLFAVISLWFFMTLMENHWDWGETVREWIPLTVLVVFIRMVFYIRKRPEK